MLLLCSNVVNRFNGGGGHGEGSDLGTVGHFFGRKTADLVAALNGTHVEGFFSAAGLGVGSFLVGLRALAKVALAVVFAIKRSLVEDLARTPCGTWKHRVCLESS